MNAADQWTKSAQESDKFNRAVEVILRHEGGYVNDPKDAGGETKFGISKRAFPDLDIKNLTKEQAKDIYRDKYWGRLQCEKMPYAIALCAFDAGVNSGLARAGKWLQEAINKTAEKYGVKERILTDGFIGPKTLQMVTTLDPSEIVEQYAKARLSFLQGLATFERFGAGWSRRVRETTQLAEAALDNGDFA